MKGIPEDSPLIVPRLFCHDVATEIDFCVTTFEAIERVRRPGPDGTVAHALLSIGPAMVMIEREWPELASRAPTLDGSSPVVLYVYVEDVDAVIQRAVASQAKLLSPIQDQFWGDRTGWIMDPAGHVWTVATRIETTSEEQRRGRWDSLRSNPN
jgi:PhnB protein